MAKIEKVPQLVETYMARVRAEGAGVRAGRGARRGVFYIGVSTHEVGGVCWSQV